MRQILAHIGGPLAEQSSRPSTYAGYRLIQTGRPSLLSAMIDQIFHIVLQGFLKAGVGEVEFLQAGYVVCHMPLSYGGGGGVAVAGLETVLVSKVLNDVV